MQVRRNCDAALPIAVDREVQCKAQRPSMVDCWENFSSVDIEEARVRQAKQDDDIMY